MKIDRFFLLFLACGVLFLYFYLLTGSIFWAFALSFLTAVLGKYAIGSLIRQRKKRLAPAAARKAAAEALVDSLVLVAEAQAVELLTPHIAARYRLEKLEDGWTFAGKPIQFLLDQRPESAPPMDAMDVARLLRAASARPNAKRLILSTGTIHQKAYDFVSKSRETRILDRKQLIDAVRLSALPLPEPTCASGKASWIKRLRAVRAHINKKRARRIALYGAFLLLLYFVLGIRSYLPIALALIAISLLALRREPERETLF